MAIKKQIKCEEGFDFTLIIANPERLDHARRTLARFCIEEMEKNKLEKAREA